MDESFIIDVPYKEITHQFEAKLFTSAYSYCIQIMVNDVPFNFEKDDEGNFRAVAVTTDDNRIQKTDKVLLQAIAGSIEKILS